MDDRERRYRRIKKLFPKADEANVINYLNYADAGIDTLTDPQLDLDMEDFCSK